MENLLDRVLGKVAVGFVAARVQSPSIGLLGEARTQAAEAALARHLEEAHALARDADAHAVGAKEAYGALAQRALQEMREDTLVRARRLGITSGLLASLHARWGDTDEPEYLDDPNLDADMRVRLLERLDAFNTVLGSYRAFLRALQPFLDGETTVLDLAAGHGGFALEATRMARSRELPIHFTATDLKPEYLALGEAIAAREGLDVRFAVQDALDTSNLAAGAYDVVVCTQSLHHFPASMNARIFREAVRVARRGVVFIDPCRSMTQGVLVPSLGIARYRDREFAHDGFVSLRRAYTPEELGLLVRLAPEGAKAEAKWMRPAHCLVRWTAPRA